MGGEGNFKKKLWSKKWQVSTTTKKWEGVQFFWGRSKKKNENNRGQHFFVEGGQKSFLEG